MNNSLVRKIILKQAIFHNTMRSKDKKFFFRRKPNYKVNYKVSFTEKREA